MVSNIMFPTSIIIIKILQTIKLLTRNAKGKSGIHLVARHIIYIRIQIQNKIISAKSMY